jgi:hypothetical protein
MRTNKKINLSLRRRNFRREGFNRENDATCHSIMLLTGLPDGQFIGHFHLNWQISEGVGQKKKFVVRNIFLAIFWPI